MDVGLVESLRRLRPGGWLIEQRSRYAPSASIGSRAWTALAGRTGTRVAPGYVALRGHDGLVNATELEAKLKFHAAMKRLIGRREPRRDGARQDRTDVVVSIDGFAKM